MANARVFRIRLSKKWITFSDDSHEMTVRRRRDPVREHTVRQLSRSLGAGMFVDDETLRLLGLNLYEMLFFNAHANEWFERVYKNSRDRNLQMILEFLPNEVELMALPWEFLFVHTDRWKEGGGKYLVLQRHVSLVRRIVRKGGKEPEAIERGRFLIVDCLPAPDEASQPGYIVKSEAGKRCGTPPSEGVDNLMVYLEGFGDVQCLRVPEPMDLEDAVAGRSGAHTQSPPHVVHLVGHGRFQAGDDAGFEFCLCPAKLGRDRWVRDVVIAERIGSHPPELVVLQTCKGGSADSYERHEGAAIALVKRGVPNVVALQQQILAGEAGLFVERFYAALREGRSAEAAVKDGRDALRPRLPGDSSFGLPVAYFQRDSGFSLPKRSDKKQTQQDTTQPDRSLRTPYSNSAVSRSQEFSVGAVSRSQEFSVITPPALAPLAEPAVLGTTPAPTDQSPGRNRSAGNSSEVADEVEGAARERSPLSVRLGTKGP